ncbi:MAG: hypothetical protein Q9163_003809 [Psora crenata]
MISLLALAIGLGLLSWLFILMRADNPSNKPARLFRSPEACKKILACTGYDNSPQRNRLTPVESRAAPNQRLVRAFDISNGFTTSEEETRKVFRTDAYDKIHKVDDAEWKHIAGFTKILIRRAIQKADDAPWNTANYILLDVLVQSVTLKISLYVLYGMDPLALEDKAIEEVASAITTLWVASKTGNVITESQKAGLKHYIAMLFPDMSSDPKDNPLNLILPVYETMARAVLLGLAELGFKSPAAPALIEQLRKYLATPTRRWFGQVQEGSRSPVSVAHIVNEILRRYPPTKRVYRKMHMTSKSKPEIVAADIEACHLDRAIWGEDSRKFRPSRWKNIDAEAQAAFMPFGGSPFVCPAKPEFGPRMIGLLVASFATQMSRDGWVLAIKNGPDSESFELVMEDTELENTRAGYASLVVWRRI